MRWLLIIFLFLTTIATFLFLYMNPVAQAYYLVIVSLVLFVLVFVVEVLGYRIGGKYLTLEKRLHDIAVEQEEVKLLSIATSQALHVLADGASRYGGPSEQHKNLIKKYLTPVSKHLPKNHLAQVNNDIKQLLSDIKQQKS